ncbi:hypothetical protein BDN72DRAFT_841664 [Pluteus cervinus]|uniref:Uncharacterized protein n=1 Tax=Pluteus cervinus TaxID=181527 RepID=A0ACD3ARW2_9AGAR|nr:hypothetical protein BDN72DRAFT_841664 [Pluteus cervinus]
MVDLPSFSTYGLILEDAYKKLDDKIAQLQERLCSLRTFRNSFAPISKIPRELLSKVFSHTQEYSGLPLQDNMDVMTRFFVSWVSRDWRNTALATPSLWTVISNKNKKIPVQIDLAEALLIRSSNWSLSVDLFHPSPDVLHACRSHMPRVQHLRLLSSPLIEELDQLLTQPAPLLTFLDLDGDLPTNPLLGVHPHLRFLKISNTVIQKALPLIAPTITNLHMINPAQSIRVHHFVNALASLPNLSELVLVKCFLGEGPVDSRPEQISLLDLQVVSITDTHGYELFSFLGSFDIPQAAITVTWPEKGKVTVNVLQEFSASLNRYQGAIPFQTRHLEMKRGDPHFSLDISSGPMQHRCSLRFPEEDISEEEIGDLCEFLSFEGLQTLSTSTLPLYIVEHNLQNAGNIQRIEFHGQLPRELTWALDLKRKVRFFSTLKELVICDIGEETAARLRYLRKALADRRAAGFGLARLVFVKCRAVDASQFEDVVDVVSVDD